MTYYNRRRFLQASAAGFLGATGALAGLGRQQALAASTTGYKALVCLMFKGGTDMFDVVLPRDQASFDAYAALRPGIVNGHEGGTRDRDNQIALNPSNASDFGTRRFGLAPEVKAFADMFESGEGALVGSVGPLLEPTTREAMESRGVDLPKSLFSHNDQQSTWMALGPEGARRGWGGGFIDAVLRNGGLARPEFSTITAGSGDVFLASDRTRLFKAPRDPENLGVRLATKKWLTSGDHGLAARERMNAFLRDATHGSSNPFARDVTAGQAAGIQSMRDYKDAFMSVGGLAIEFPDTKIGKQLAAIANSIHIRSAIGNSRQVFYADIGGFDTHDSQGREIVGPLSQAAEAVKAFRAAMIKTGAWDQVTLFTMSDFGRTLTENGDGTDHGWGSHHFVFGGSVAGGRIYGEMPELDPGMQHFTKDRARLIPHVAVEQYAATLGGWFGLDGDEIARVLPNLDRFDGADLGFMAGGTT